MGLPKFICVSILAILVSERRSNASDCFATGWTCEGTNPCKTASDGGVSLVAKLHDSCGLSYCCSVPNSVCIGNVCVCQNGYYEDLNTCLPGKKIEESCKIDEECLAFTENALCASGECHCEDGFKTEDNIKCTKGNAFGEFCSSTDECESEMECINSKCECQAGLGFDIYDRRCRIGYLGDYCRNDDDCSPFIKNSECRDGICDCIARYIVDGNERCIEGAKSETRKRSIPENDLGKECENVTECRTPFTVCAEGVCSCMEGFEEIDNKRCMPDSGSRYGENCDSNADCTTPYTRCIGNVCSCIEDYSPIENECVLTTGSKAGESCTNPSDCKGKYTYCIEGKCQCIFGYHRQGDDCAPIYNTDSDSVFDCESTVDCRGKYSTCEEGRCVCMKGFYRQGHDCIPSTGIPGEPCNLPSNCSSPSTTCSNNKCECIGYHYKQGFECIDIAKSVNPYGSHCTNDEDCKFAMLAYTQCTEQKCLCLPGFVQQGYDCVRAEGIGFFCTEQADCKIENSVCNNRRCSCAANFTVDGFQCVKLSDLRRRQTWSYPYAFSLRECISDAQCPPPAKCNPFTYQCTYPIVTSPLPGSPCNTNQDCSAPNLICDPNDYICKCSHGYISNGFTCTPYKQPPWEHEFQIRPGSPCHSDAHCNPPFLICKRETETCVCGNGYIQNGEYCSSRGKQLTLPPPPISPEIPIYSSPPPVSSYPNYLYPNLPRKQVILPPPPISPEIPFYPFLYPNLPPSVGRYRIRVNIKYPTHGIENLQCNADNDCKVLYMRCSDYKCVCAPEFKFENGYCLYEKEFPLESYQSGQSIIIDPIQYPVNSEYDKSCNINSDCSLRYLQCIQNKCRCLSSLEKHNSNCVQRFTLPLSYNLGYNYNPYARGKRSTSTAHFGKKCTTNEECPAPALICTSAYKCECAPGYFWDGNYCKKGETHYPNFPARHLPYNQNPQHVTSIISHSRYVSYTYRVSSGAPCVYGQCLVRGLVCDPHQQKCVCDQGFRFNAGFCEITEEHHSPIHHQIRRLEQPSPEIYVNVIDQSQNAPRPIIPEYSRQVMYPNIQTVYPPPQPGLIPQGHVINYPTSRFLGIPPHVLLPGLSANVPPPQAVPPLPPPHFLPPLNPLNAYPLQDQQVLSDSRSIGTNKQKRSLGDACEQNQDCQELPYTVCFLNRCQCAEGYFTYMDGCRMKSPYLAESCDNETECKTAHSECSLDVLRCLCVQGFSRNHEICIEDGLLRGICLPGAVCNQSELECHLSDFRCRCKQGYVAHTATNNCTKQTD